MKKETIKRAIEEGLRAFVELKKYWGLDTESLIDVFRGEYEELIEFLTEYVYNWSEDENGSSSE